MDLPLLWFCFNLNTCVISPYSFMQALPLLDHAPECSGSCEARFYDYFCFIDILKIFINLLCSGHWLWSAALLHLLYAPRVSLGCSERTSHVHWQVAQSCEISRVIRYITPFVDVSSDLLIFFYIHITVLVKYHADKMFTELYTSNLNFVIYYKKILDILQKEAVLLPLSGVIKSVKCENQKKKMIKQETMEGHYGNNNGTTVICQLCGCRGDVCVLVYV